MKELTNSLSLSNKDYILENIGTIEECKNALNIEYGRKEYFENKGIVLVDKNKEFEITSLQLVDVINNFRKEEGNDKKKRHDILLRDIRDEIKALESVSLNNAHNFEEVEYIDKKGESRPCFSMNKAGAMQMLNKESAVVRYKTQLYIEQLEKRNEELNTPSYMIQDVRARLKAYERELDQQDYRQCLERINTLEQLKVNLMLSHSGKTYTTTELAKEIGFKSSQALNKELKDRKIQYKVNGTWVLTSKYSDKGYEDIKQKVLDNGRVEYYRRWTEEGRKFILNMFLN